MLKIIIFFAAAFILWRMFKGDKKKKQEKSAKEQENLVAAGLLTRDPVCGTYVDTNSAISVRDKDTVHYFCSYDCRDSFLKSRSSLPDRNNEEVFAEEVLINEQNTQKEQS